jgi:hypothetical protein
MKYAKALLIGLLFSACFSSLCAQQPVEKRYQVNLLVFTHVTPDALRSESWQKKLLKPSVGQWRTLLPEETSPQQLKDPAVNFQLLGSPKKAFSPKLLKALAAKGDHVLLNIAWRQPGISTNGWIHFFGGAAYDAKGEKLTQPSEIIHSMASVPGAVYWRLNGGIRVDFNRFMLAKIRLYLTLPLKTVANISAHAFGRQFNLAPMQTFTLFQTQRFHLNQFVYFDHPLVGALLYLSLVHKG